MSPGTSHERLEQEADDAANRTRTGSGSIDLSGVRLHTGAAATRAAGDLRASAFTVGNHIVFGRGRLSGSPADAGRLLAHELAHVGQQAAVGTTLLQRRPDPTAPKEDAELALGTKLVKDFPKGVSVAFYDSAEAEAQRRASDWALAQTAVGLKKTTIRADQLQFGKPIPDRLDLAPTIKTLTAVLTAAVVKATPTTDLASVPPQARIANLALFGHGTPDWCSVGMNFGPKKARSMVKTIAPGLAQDVNVVLYTCSGARGTKETESWTKGTFEEGGADSLAAIFRDALVEEGVAEGKVWGHTTVGHVSRNFALRVFRSSSGKGADGLPYAFTHVWEPSTRVAYLQQIGALATADGYVLDDKGWKKFYATASTELKKLLYTCYADAHEKLTFQGQALAEKSPLFPSEVGKLIRDHWDKNFWSDDAKRRIRDAAIKAAGLKKQPTATPATK